MRGAAVFLAALGLVALFTHTYASDGGNESSRLAVAESLVERGTLAIDDSTFRETVDRVRIGGHWYSDKPPLLSVAGATVYAILRHGFGVSFRESPRIAIFFTSLLVSGISVALLAFVLFRALPRFGIDGGNRFLQTAAAVSGTLVLAYGTSFTNHSVTALTLVGGFVAFLGRERPRAALLAGLWFGATAALDIPIGGVFLAVFGGLVLVETLRSRRLATLLAFTGGGALPLAITAVLGLLAYGDPRPPYFVPGAYDYPGSIHNFQGSLGFMRVWGTAAQPHPLSYAFHAFLGNRGFILHSPVLVLAVPAIVWLAARRGGAFRRESLAAAACAAILFAYYVAGTIDSGGWSYGFRYFVPLSPLLLFIAAPYLARPWPRRALAVLLAPSVLLALLGAYDPWPVVDEGMGKQTFVPYPRCPIVANLAVAAQDLLPPGRARDAAVRALLGEDEAQSYGYLGRALANRRNFTKALGCFRRAARAAPSDPALRGFILQIEALASD